MNELKLSDELYIGEVNGGAVTGRLLQHKNGESYYDNAGMNILFCPLTLRFFSCNIWDMEIYNGRKGTEFE